MTQPKLHSWLGAKSGLESRLLNIWLNLTICSEKGTLMLIAQTRKVYVALKQAHKHTCTLEFLGKIMIQVALLNRHSIERQVDLGSYFTTTNSCLNPEVSKFFQVV